MKAEHLEVDDKGNYEIVRSLSYEYMDPYGDPFLIGSGVSVCPISETAARNWLMVQNLPDDATAKGSPLEL